MEGLIAQGMPQRTAHHKVGALVAIAKARKVSLLGLTEAEIKSVDESLDGTIRAALGVSGAVQSYRSFGSSNPDRVEEQIQRWEKLLTHAT